MTPIDVRPYVPGDLIGAKWLTRAVAEASEAQIGPRDPAYTGRAPDGSVLWVAAIKMQKEDPFHGMAWLATMDGAARKYARSFAEIRRVLMEHADGMRRVTAYVDVAREEAGRFLEHMGFVKEGTLRAFGTDGHDYHVYGLIPGEDG